MATAAVLASCANPPPSGYLESADRSPAWSPAGDSIAYVHVRASQDDPQPNGVYVIAAAGGPSRLVLEIFARSVDWSANGRRLVFDSPAGLFTCTTTGDSILTLVNGFAYLPSWSPLGDLVAFDDITHVWVVPDTGGVPVCVTTSLGGGRDPAWSPDGQALLILAGLPGAQGEELATVSLAGELFGRVTHDMNEDRSPSWAPTGAGVAWNKWPRGRDGRVHPQFWVTDTSGTSPRLLIAGEGQIDWSPDGTQFVFSRITNSGGLLFTASTAGSNLRQITF